jgi:hypothetical protein
MICEPYANKKSLCRIIHMRKTILLTFCVVIAFYISRNKPISDQRDNSPASTENSNKRIVIEDEIPAPAKKTAHLESKTTSGNEVKPVEPTHSDGPSSQTYEAQNTPKNEVPEVIKALEANQVNKFLKESKKLTNIKKEILFPPGCYYGEFYPYIGKPDRYEAELFISGDKGFDPNSETWEVSKFTHFTVLKMGSPFLTSTIKSFKEPGKDSKDVGVFILFNNTLFQVFKKESTENLTVRFFEKNEGNWTIRTDFRMKFLGVNCHDESTEI